MALKIVVLKTEEEKNQGLQHVRSLPADTIVVFKNVSPGEYFHTKNCYIVMDIIPVDRKGRALKCWTCAPGLDSVGPMPPGTTSVIEANGGWLRNHLRYNKR